MPKHNARDTQRYLFTWVDHMGRHRGTEVYANNKMDAYRSFKHTFRSEYSRIIKCEVR